MSKTENYIDFTPDRRQTRMMRTAMAEGVISWLEKLDKIERLLETQLNLIPDNYLDVEDKELLEQGLDALTMNITNSIRMLHEGAAECDRVEALYLEKDGEL